MSDIFFLKWAWQILICHFVIPSLIRLTAVNGSVPSAVWISDTIDASIVQLTQFSAKLDYSSVCYQVQPLCLCTTLYVSPHCWVHYASVNNVSRLYNKMFTEDIKHKIATKNQEQRDHEKNGQKHQHSAENDWEKTELLWPHMADARWQTDQTGCFGHNRWQEQERKHLLTYLLTYT